MRPIPRRQVGSGRKRSSGRLIPISRLVECAWAMAISITGLLRMQGQKAAKPCPLRCRSLINRSFGPSVESAIFDWTTGESFRRHLTNTSIESRSRRGRAFLESFRHVVRSEPPTDGSFVARQTTSPLPTSSIPSHATQVLRCVNSIASVWSYEFDSVLPEFFVQFVGIMGVVTDKILWSLRNNHLDQCGGGQLHFVRTSALNRYRHRETMAVCHSHDLHSFTTFCFADLRSPFLAGAKLASMKASRTSRQPRIRRSSASASKTPRIIPDRTHC
jgi:hypothetical protein